MIYYIFLSAKIQTLSDMTKQKAIKNEENFTAHLITE